MSERDSTDACRRLRRLGLWYWNEPRFAVRFVTALAVLAPFALLIRWAV